MAVEESEVVYKCASGPALFNMELEIADLDGDVTCLVCDAIASHLVRLSQHASGENEVELGRAVLLCADCHAFVKAEDPEGPTEQFPANQRIDDERQDGPEGYARIARRITGGVIESAAFAR